jgi:hypothetical protein
MFRYAAESAAAIKTVRELLGPDGPFGNDELLRTDLGSRFFLSLTEADPKAALRRLQQTIGTQTKEELLTFTTGRRNILWALQRMAVWKELCPDSARLFLALGGAENETFANNAGGMFVELFSPAYGVVAPTEASLEERFPVLQEAFASDSPERRMLAIRACNAGLETQHFTRSIGAEYQGLRQPPKLWMPKTWGELFDAYRRIWNLLLGVVDNLTQEEQEKAVAVLLERSWGIISIENLAPMVVETLVTLRERPWVKKEVLLNTIVRILRYAENIPTLQKDALLDLKEQLTGNDFPSLMKRYISMDLLEDYFDTSGKPVTEHTEKIEPLAKQALKDPALLTPELAWLVTEQARHGYEFGYLLGKQDNDHSLLSSLLTAQRNAGEKPSAFFLGGYLRTLFEKDTARWEEQLDALANDSKLMSLVPELTWRSGMTDRAALRVLTMAKKGLITAATMRVLRFGNATKDISEPVFTQWIEFLLSVPERSAITLALDLSNVYFLRAKHVAPKDLTFSLLTHPLLFQKRDGPIDTMEEYYWAKLAEAFIRDYPEKSLELAEVMLQHLGAEGAVVHDFQSETSKILDQITRSNPTEAWHIITKYLGPPIDGRAYRITHWLQGGAFDHNEGILPFIPLEELWRWVDADIETRSWYLASFVPKILIREPGKICLAREVLIRYGSRDDVRRNLMSNFSSEGWMGPASNHYRAKKEMLMAFRAEEENENVKRWIDEYIESLDQYINKAQGSEEREEF